MTAPNPERQIDNAVMLAVMKIGGRLVWTGFAIALMLAGGLTGGTVWVTRTDARFALFDLRLVATNAALGEVKGLLADALDRRLTNIEAHINRGMLPETKVQLNDLEARLRRVEQQIPRQGKKP